MNSKSRRQFRLETFFDDERELNVLIRTLARKLLKEKKTELPVSVLAAISGVSEQRWAEVYSDSYNLIDDIIIPLLEEADHELAVLKKEERNFLDKIRHILMIIYKINSTFPELMILFHRITTEGDGRKLKIGKYMNDLKNNAYKILLHQIHLEGIAEKDGPMEKLFIFLIEQLLMTAQNQMLEYCEEYYIHRDMSVFPCEEDWVEDLMEPITGQLEGFTAV